MNRPFILLSINRALIGNITANMRGITVDYDDDSVLLKYYLAKEPEPYEEELIDEIETEVLADMDEEVVVRTEIVVTQSPAFELAVLKDWVYKRYEETVEVDV